MTQFSTGVYQSIRAGFKGAESLPFKDPQLSWAPDLPPAKSSPDV